MTIRQWLENPSDFNVGADLYERYGDLQGFKRTLRRAGESEALKMQLIYELSKHQGVDEPSGVHESDITPPPAAQSVEDSEVKKSLFCQVWNFLKKLKP